MLGETHQLTGTAAAAGTGYATGMPWTITALAALAALVTSKLPDQIEKPFGVRVIPHRHWLSHGILIVPLYLLAGLILLAPYGPVVLVLYVGASVGVLAHLAADGCSLSGLPGFPVCRDVHLLPRVLRYRVGRR